MVSDTGPWAVNHSTIRPLLAANALISHHLVGFDLDDLVDPGDVVFCVIIDLFFPFIAVVFGNVLLFFLVFDMLDAVAADIADRYLGLLAHLFDLMDQLLTAFLAQRRDIQADDLAVAER